MILAKKTVLKMLWIIIMIMLNVNVIIMLHRRVIYVKLYNI